MSSSPFDILNQYQKAVPATEKQTSEPQKQKHQNDAWVVCPISEEARIIIHTWLEEARTYKEKPISKIDVLYRGKPSLGYEVSIEETEKLNKEKRELFTAYHREKTSRKTPWIMSAEYGIGKQNLHNVWSNILFYKPPPRRKKIK